MKLDAKKIEKLISEASNVIIMAHKNLDLDALGSSLGMYYLSKKIGKNTFLLIEEEKSEKGVSRSLLELNKRDLKVNVKKLKELKLIIDQNTLLIVLDVHIPNITQNSAIFKMVNKVIVIDHHIKDKDGINDAEYLYIADMQSSTSEVVVELLKELDIYIPSYIATIMLAGIVVDTNRFSIKTSYLTYDAASYLSQQGAETKELQYLLKENLERYIKRQEIISKIEIINNSFAVGIGKSEIIYYKEDIAKVSDTMLLLNNIEAAFTIAKIDDNTIGISARSLGNVDVQKIMEKLNGGGHKTDAATQINNISILDGKNKLLEIIKNL